MKGLTNCLAIWMRFLWRGMRTLRRSPGFAVSAIVTLALGIGATTMVFTVTRAILFEPFPYVDLKELVTFHVQQVGYEGPVDYSIPECQDFRSGNRAFAALVGYRNARGRYRNQRGVEEAAATWVTDNAFTVLGAKAKLGRTLLPSDANPGSNPVCVISDRFWHEQLSGKPVVGQTLEVDDTLRTIVGIMPPRFQFQHASIWLPASLSVSANGRSVRLGLLGRLKPGVSLSAASVDFDVQGRRIVNAYPSDFPEKQFTLSVRSLLDETVGGFKNLLYTVFAGVTMLLLIACSNVSNLLLVRATVRDGELSIRAVLGASRLRIVGELLLEALIVAASGAVAGCLL